eukprot:jgi/Undpi1/6253/HiC_scaffold_20.g08737.m1
MSVNTAVVHSTAAAVHDRRTSPSTVSTTTPPSTMAAFFGNYDWKFLCLPPMPCKANSPRRQPPFFAHDDAAAPFIAILMGLQHALAMVGGVITVPLLIAGNFDANLGAEQTQYLVSAALIVSGATSLIQVSQLKIPRTSITIGTGLISVMGTSFTFLPVARDAISQMKGKSDFLDDDGVFDGEKAYGAVLGTFLVCSWVEILLAFIKPAVLRKVFPPIVTGVTVTLIGASLVGTGFKYWGGGAFCGDNVDRDDPPLCGGNGEVLLPFGSAEYVGLGFSVFAMLVRQTVFGSPFMRSANVMLALLFGYLVAALSSKNGDDYVVSSKIDAAESITFLWVFTYPLSVYPPLILPAILAFIVTTVETIGDVTTTADVSRLPVEGPEHFQRIRGGLLGDGISSFISALCTSMPNTTFSQNNGVIALTRCASRRAGVACAVWLIVFGILSKIAAFFTSIPDCVLGGMTTFLFANVAFSGVTILATTTSIGASRRTRFIVVCSLSLGLGVTLAPAWATNNLWPCSDCGEALRSFRDGVILVMSTGYSMGCATAVLLNLIVPAEASDEDSAITKGSSAPVGSSASASAANAADFASKA